MSEQSTGQAESQPTMTTRIADMWGHPISEERQSELSGILEAWEAPGADHGERKGPFDGGSDEDGVQLTGADVYWLVGRVRGFSGIVPDLHLEGADLRRAHLVGAVLRDAHLEGATLWGAHLVGADLTRAHLEGAIFREAHLAWATLIGAHLEGAALHDADLKRADLTRAHLERAALHDAHLEGATLIGAHLEGVNLYAAYLVGANLSNAHLEGATLIEAHLERANLSNAHLEGASLRGAHLDGAGMQEAFLDIATNLHDVAVSTPAAGCISVADVRWGGINLAVISDWTPFTERRMVLGDERAAWTWKPKPFTEMPEQRKRPPRERRQARVAHAQEQSRQRLSKFQEAVRANRQFATTLRDQGMNEEADYFAYRAQVVQRAIFRQRHKRGRWLFSLFLDRIAGYGYKPERSLYTYLAVIAAFTGLYLIASFGVLTFGLHPTQVHSLQWYEALVLSVSSFHGRGFFQPLQNPGDPVAILAAGEAVFGLIIEVSFIATFTQRFFGR